jgi:hypothetical protein
MFAVISLLVALAATIAAFVVIDNTRHLFGAVLVLAGAALGIIWKFTTVSELPHYRSGIIALFVITLVGSGLYFFATSNKPSISLTRAAGSDQVKPPPNLSFVLDTPAKVAWCQTYQITVTGHIPTGYSIVIFDSATDLNYNFSGPYNYDGTVSPVPRVAGEFTSKYIFIGDRYAIRNGKSVSNTGFRAVVIALLVPNQSVNVLSQVVAAPTGWGLRQLPSNLNRTVLDVERNSNAAHCLSR